MSALFDHTDHTVRTRRVRIAGVAYNVAISDASHITRLAQVHRVEQHDNAVLRRVCWLLGRVTFGLAVFAFAYAMATLGITRIG